jgi:hypothetical protein
MIQIDVKTFAPCNIDDPDFKHKNRVHDWRNYIPYEFQKIWGELPLIARFALVIMAEERASDEEWE